mmetsp:Transcript_3771/g.9889  ORF Transcript_3771/g.9889 Transcript_3771/m.9889 type:complete len:504 (+) Transcript_3771:123-1634(+)
MSYKQNASANRDALFGSERRGTKKKKPSSKGTAKKSSSFGGPSGAKTTSSTATAKHSSTSSRGYKYSSPKKPTMSIGLTGDAKTAKLKEAEDNRDKAKKAMQRSLFSRPDPLVASNYYKRAADAYQKCNEFRLERMCRIDSADCQLSVGAFATAAADYTRAAQLFEVAEDETIEMKREIGRKCLLNASDAWLEMNEPGKAADAKVSAAKVLTWGDDSNALSKAALTALEEAVEAHVPDPLNPYSRYRQTGISTYIDPNSEETADNPSSQTLSFAEQHIVMRPYAHESVQDVVHLFISFGEYLSALYAQGAVSVLLSRDGVSSLTLSRSFVAETILTLAAGDPIAAEREFLDRHVQKTSYLSSRECKLGEELFRAVKMRDHDALEEARSMTKSNRAALGNLHESLREVVKMIQITGVARKDIDKSSKKSKKDVAPKTKPKRSSSSNEKEVSSFEELCAAKTGYEEETHAADNIDFNNLQQELDALDISDDSVESDLDDDELDLR